MWSLSFIVSKLLEIIQFVLVLSFLVVIHELGHYFVAKWRKVRVEEFGIGYPPRAKKLFTYKGTLFSLNWIPFGGFVKLDGEDASSEELEKSENKQFVADDTQHEQPFYKKSKASRLAIILAGAAINFLFGVVAFSIFFSVKGIPTIAPNPRIGEVAVNSPAATAGVPINVDILAIQAEGNKVETHSADDVIKGITGHQGQTVKLITSGPCVENEQKCQEEQQEFDVYVRRKEETPSDQGSLGIRFGPVVTSTFYPWWQMPFRGAWYGTEQAFVLSYLIVTSLAEIISSSFHGHIPGEVSGVVGIFDQGSKAGFFSNGPLILLNFAGIISVNLAVMNVLPIPALDGGRAVMILLESIVGKKKVASIEGSLNYVALLILIGLTLLITIKDVFRLFVR
jgi:regulator of sigma E protease